MARAPQLRVLVVDDSAVARATLSAVLGAAGDIRVTTAPDPLVAQRKMSLDWPDVILLDLVMPRVDGFAFLRDLAPGSPPVVVCAAGVLPGSPEATRALAAGAAAVVAKPSGLQALSAPTGEDLVRTLRSVAGKKRASEGSENAARSGAETRRAPPPPAATPRAGARPDVTLLAVGASLGGTDALYSILSALPADMPGLVVVQHMPEAFTASFARSLNSACALEVREARDGEPVERGVALLAKGDHHLEVVGGPGRYRVRVVGGPRVSGHRPSVDVLFTSVARAAGASGVGLLLTGMGSDGAQGLLTMRLAGGRTAAQDERSSVVYGMPREASRLGAADEILPLDQCAAFLIRSHRRR